MILYKTIGAICLLASSLFIYFEMQSFQKKRIIQLEGYLSFIEYIKNQVECYMLPIDKIISLCDKGLLEKCGVDTTIKYKSLEEIMQSTYFYIDKEAENLIIAFSKDFGTQYHTEQIKSCERYYQLLAKETEKLKEKNLKEKKIRLALCICISFSIVLLLI